MKQLDWPGVKQATWLQAGLSKPQSEGCWMGEGETRCHLLLLRTLAEV